MRWHRRTAIAGLTIAVAALAGGVAVGASTGTLPIAAGGHDGPSPSASPTATHTPATESTSAKPPAPDVPSSAPNGQGPDATGPAKFGLCKAFASGQGATNGGKLDSVAFQALAKAAAANGTDVATFCADATPGGNPPHGEATPPVSAGGAGAADDHPSPPSDTHGAPADPGSNGQGHRP